MEEAGQHTSHARQKLAGDKAVGFYSRVMKIILPLFLTAVYFALPGFPEIEAQVPKPSAPIQFVDITAAAGIKWNIKTLAPGPKYLIETMGGGGGFIDYNGDGLLDIYLVCYSQTPQPAGDGMLRDV